jgi:hypothetical protein
MSDKVLGWYWLPYNGCLYCPPYTEVEVGQTQTAEGPLELCENGMHASRRALDALRYARGPIVCRVELSGEILEGKDRLCARHRKVLAMADATKTLHEFACWCTEQLLLRERAAGREINPRGWAAIETKRKWLKGEATDEKLDDAYKAAEVAAWVKYRYTSDATWAAVLAAFRSPTKVATWATTVASSAAARACGWAASSDALWYASWHKIRATQNAKLEEMLNGLLEGEK